MEKQLGRLTAFRDPLIRYMEVNNSTAQELRFEGVACLVQLKEKMVKVELTLIQRIAAVTQQYQIKDIEVDTSRGKWNCWAILSEMTTPTTTTMAITAGEAEIESEEHTGMQLFSNDASPLEGIKSSSLSSAEIPTSILDNIVS